MFKISSSSRNAKYVCALLCALLFFPKDAQAYLYDGHFWSMISKITVSSSSRTNYFEANPQVTIKNLISNPVLTKNEAGQIIKSSFLQAIDAQPPIDIKTDRERKISYRTVSEKTDQDNLFVHFEFMLWPALISSPSLQSSLMVINVTAKRNVVTYDTHNNPQLEVQEKHFGTLLVNIDDNKDSFRDNLKKSITAYVKAELWEINCANHGTCPNSGD